MQESSPGAAPEAPVEPRGQYITMCPCTKAAGTVISAAAMVQQSCGAPRARTACSKAPLPRRASGCHALAEGRMVFSGRQQCWRSRGMQLQQGQGNAGISENKVDEIRTREMKVPKKKKFVTWHHSFYFISWIAICLETHRGKPPSFCCLHFPYQVSIEIFFNHIVYKTCTHAQSETVM